MDNVPILNIEDTRWRNITTLVMMHVVLILWMLNAENLRAIVVTIVKLPSYI